MNINAVDMANRAMASQEIGNTSAKQADYQPAAKGDDTTVSVEKVKQVVQQMQSHLDSMNISLQYYFYGKHNQKIAIKVVNKETGAVIREIPPKEMQSLQVKMSELCGMIFNGKC